MTRFRGEFALAIAEPRPGRVYLARDGVGVKPLYWARASGRLHIASEIKALIRPGQPDLRGAARPPRLGRRRVRAAVTALPGPAGARRVGRSGHRPGRGGQAGPGRVRGQRPGPGGHRPAGRRHPVRRPGQLADAAARPGHAPGLRGVHHRRARQRGPRYARRLCADLCVPHEVIELAPGQIGLPAIRARHRHVRADRVRRHHQRRGVGPAVPPHPRDRDQGRAHRRRHRRAVRRLPDVSPGQPGRPCGGCSCTRSPT